MSDPFVGRQVAYIGTFLLFVGLVGCASRRHVVPFTFTFGVALQGLVVLAAGLIGGEGASEFLLLLVVVSGGTVAMVAGVVDDWSRDEGTDLGRTGAIEEPVAVALDGEGSEGVNIEPITIEAIASSPGEARPDGTSS